MRNEIAKMPDTAPEEPLTDVVVEVELRPNDVYTPFLWCRENLVRWVCSGLLGYIFYDLFTRGSEALKSFPGGTSILAILALVAVLILCGLLIFPYLRTRAAFRKSPYLTKLREYKFGSTGVKIQSDDVASECKWSLFKRIVETPTVFLLMYADHAAAYVPKRCFQSRDEIVRLRQLFRDRASGQLQLRRD